MSWKLYCIVFLCGLGDALTTAYGLDIGLVETRLLFVPFLSTLILFLGLWFLDWRKLKVPDAVRATLKGGLVFVSLYPILNNLYFILVMVI